MAPHLEATLVTPSLLPQILEVGPEMCWAADQVSGPGKRSAGFLELLARGPRVVSLRFSSWAFSLVDLGSGPG